MRPMIVFVWIAFGFVTLLEVAQKHLEGKQLEGGKNEHVRYKNFKPFVRHMLNISQVLASFHVTDFIDCAFECLSNVACFSFNFALITDSLKLNVCHLLSTDKYNPSTSFVPSDEFIHYAIPTPCESFPCQNGGSCLPLYGKNSYVCNCLKGNDGTYCEKVCQGALGMESRDITDRQISASSEYDANHTAHQGRLHFRETSTKAGSWSVTAKNLNSLQWLQVDLNQLTKVTGVATQGRNNTNVWSGNHRQWVTRYKLQFSEDSSTFQYYKEKGQISEKEFVGNEDWDTIVYHELDPPIRARYIRFRPTAWKGWISMRVELYGC